MTRIRLLAAVANDPKGATLEVDDERAVKLIRTGYAVPIADRKVKKEIANATH